MPTTPAAAPGPRLRAGDVVLLRESQDYVEGEVITVLSEGRYKVRWTSGVGYRDRVTTVTADQVRKKLYRTTGNRGGSGA
jgi:translation initiation factor IF-1